MAMAQLASSTPSTSSSSSSASASKASKTAIQTLLGQFDTQINTMMDYPAKDTINALTMLAEQTEFAPEIVSFLETKIHRVAPNCKLPIFYLTDSILKNVRGPYLSLFAVKIVPLYCNCVRQVSGKDLKRFIHVLNTWETTRLFSKDALVQMRCAANRALQQADPSAHSVPASINEEKSAHVARLASALAPSAKASQQELELRSLLTKLQNDMGIHPTEHMSLEEVRTHNPEYYNELLAYHAASKAAPASVSQGTCPTVAPAALTTRQEPLLPHPLDARRASPPPDVRTGRSAGHAAPPAARVKPGASRPVTTRKRGVDESSAHSSNVAHLMQLLKRKQHVPSPPAAPLHEITNDPPRAPDAAAVMSILQKLKGMSSASASVLASPQRLPVAPPCSNSHAPEPPAPLASTDHASRMWFSDKIVAHKDRVESNVQKLYAALPLVCRESGVRFRDQAHLDAHLDFLFQFNRARKERGRGGSSRAWYPAEAQWIADFSVDAASRESTSSSFFDRSLKERALERGDDAAAYEKACVPVDETITWCQICGEPFSKRWDEDEEDWVYTNAVAGTIHLTDTDERETIFHKYCYETVMAHSKYVTPAHLIPVDRESGGERRMESGGKRTVDENESDSDVDEDVKRVKRE
ncbi:hypothetical protein PsorP6_017045 [Peronosclerospora sorghi]|uniref:Uncharacterized protein n=1 Tax=Peronosclerospora sorghi TaxID=230839 RepID=A0ACC0WF14_9STRA|nr:hypothetical protein PsorP6_017045 [Peronosclerospora sorghi]